MDNDTLTPDKDQEYTKVETYTLETKRNNTEISVTDTQEKTGSTENIPTNSLPDIFYLERVNTEDNDKHVPDEDMHTIQATTAEVDKLETNTATTVNYDNIDMNSLLDIEQITKTNNKDKDKIQPDETASNEAKLEMESAKDILVTSGTEEIEDNFETPVGKFAITKQ